MEKIIPNQEIDGSSEIDSSNDEFNKIVSKIVGYAWLILIIISIVLLVANLIAYFKYDYSPMWYTWPLSYVLGAFVSLFAFNLLKKGIKTANATSTMKNYLIRYSIYGFVIAYAILNDKINPIIVFCGYFTIKLAIYIHTFSNQK